mmetsp:Transcript_4800/g.8955  ORF Transcript_4800/g.8955 Transcript_4800/m.8955 type:complete len:430 (+) Transcript_4800:887-2176(+)
MLLKLLSFTFALTQVAAKGGEWIETIPPIDYLIYSVAALALICFGGLMSGLNVGMLSLDELELEQKLASGTEEEKKMARKVLPVISNHHWLLVSILLGNAAAGEALPVVLDMMFNEVLSVIISVTFVLICGEIIPQALMTGPDQLKIASRLVPLVRTVMYVFSPISYPLALLLDKILGTAPTTTNFTSEDLRKLLILHQYTYENRPTSTNDKGLSPAQIQMINGAIDLRKQVVSDFMISTDNVFSLSDELLLDDDALVMIRKKGYSRIPIYAGRDPSSIYSILLSKKLIGYEPPSPQVLKDAHLKLRKPMYVEPDLSMLKLLQRFQEGTNHMAFVCQHPPSESLSVIEIKNLSSNVIGVITLEDVLEKLLDSNIYDEADIERLRQVSHIQPEAHFAPVEQLRISRRVLAGKTPIVRHVKLDAYYRIDDH